LPEDLSNKKKGFTAGVGGGNVGFRREMLPSVQGNEQRKAAGLWCLPRRRTLRAGSSQMRTCFKSQCLVEKWAGGPGENCYGVTEVYQITAHGRERGLTNAYHNTGVKTEA